MMIPRESKHVGQGQ